MGAVACKLLQAEFGIEIVGFVRQVHDLRTEMTPATSPGYSVEANVVRCPDADMGVRMQHDIEALRDAGDFVRRRGRGSGAQRAARAGRSAFDKLEANLAKGFIRCPPRGLRIGLRLCGTRITGQQQRPVLHGGRTGSHPHQPLRGVQGGISNGEDVVVRIAFKPTATVKVEQDTVDRRLQDTTLAAKGRHHPCVLPLPCPSSRR